MSASNSTSSQVAAMKAESAVSSTRASDAGSQLEVSEATPDEGGLSRSLTSSKALQTQGESIEARIDTASTKEEALSLAMEAAELCMRALKIATKAERPEIRAQCQSLLNEAERIKQMPEEWVQLKKDPNLSDSFPSVDLKPVRSKNLDSSANIPPFPSPKSKPAKTTPSPKPNSLNLQPYVSTSALKSQVQDSKPKPKTTARLREPISKRLLPVAEQVLLLQASKLNGFKFPPWSEPPKPEEFELQYGAEPFRDTSDLCLSEHQLTSFDGWKRAEDAVPPPSWFPGDRSHTRPTMQATRAIDLVQDAATDCSVVASLAAGASRAGKGHAKIMDEILFPYDHNMQQPELSPNGKYILKLNFNGCYRRVVIDDRLPVSKTQRLLHVIDRKNPALLWPALFEKAYLKVRGGYDFPGSNSSTDLWILTGWIPEQVFLQDDTTDPSDVWRRISRAFQYGDVLVTMGTAKMSHRVERDSGLAGQHDYAVLDVKEDGEQKFVLLKNPWCEGGSWKGSIPQASLQRLSRIENGLVVAADDTEDLIHLASNSDSTPSQQELSPGTFWIDWNNVLQHFDSIYLNWNSGPFSHREDIHFSWDLASKRSAAGSFVNNPQFAVSSTKEGALWLLLCRHFKDTAEQSGDSLLNVNVGSSGEFIGYMSLYVYDGKGLRIPISSSPDERGPYVDSPQTLLRLDVPAATTYTVVISEQDLPSINHTFSLMAFSSMPVQISQAKDRFAYTSSLVSAWTSATSGGGAHIVTYSTNPQFSLTVDSRAPLALLIETPNPDLNVHLKLVLGSGKRIISLSQRDILIDSGDYRRGSAYAEIPEIEAGTYTVVCSTFEAGQKASFSLHVCSSTQTKLKQLPSENAGRLSKALPTACFNWNNNKIAAPISPHRLIKFSAMAKSRSSSHSTTRSPVRLSIELGRGPERRILSVSNAGDYMDADGGGVRTDEIDVWSEMRRYAEMYLVLERMAGPETTGEERFEVEAWCDGRVDEVCTIGTWRKWDD